MLPAGTASEAGTIRAPSLLASATVPPPAPERVTVHVHEAPPASPVGAQRIELTVVSVPSMIEEAAEEPFMETVTITVWLPATVPAVAMNVATVDPGATETEDGTVSAALLLESATVPPAVFESVTVHVAVPPLFTDVGAQVSELTFAGAIRERDADCDDPFSDVVTVAVSSTDNAPAVMENVAVVTPAATEIDPGALTAALLLEIATVPPVAFANVTVHVPASPEVNAVGEHTREVMETVVASERFTVRED